MANPEETGLHPYAITLSGTGDTTITVGSAFGTGTQNVQSPNASSVIYGGEIVSVLTSTGTKETDTNEYIGTATNSTGAVVGFVILDETSKTYYLMATSAIAKNTTLTLHTSSGINDSHADNWNLGTVGSVAYCFLAGTAIATPTGESAVETLKAGDLVNLSDGRVAPVSWLGIQTVSTLFTDKLRTAPIRIQAGALAEGLPARDLLISPDHAILLDGALVHAGALVNGTTITRETDIPTVFTYYHVEVADHSLVLAEGVAAETFIDNVDRMAFDNWAEHTALHEGVAIPEMDYPRAKSARQVPMATRERLAARAVELTGEAPAEVPAAA